jgi:hypothetical protein
MPDASYAGFSTHIFLVANDPRTSVGPDWSHPDVVRFDVSLQDDGTWLGTLRYKTDAPESNGEMFDGGAGELGSASSSTAVGRWGFTFNDDTSATVFSPEASTDVLMPAAAATKFSAPVTAYFGCMPNALERIGQAAVLAQAKIQGAVGGTDITDDFPGPELDAALWEKAAEHPEGVIILDGSAAFWLGWTLPDAGFSPEIGTGVGANGWTRFTGASTPLRTDDGKLLLVTSDQLPDSDEAYWRMVQPTFTKLQILLPGETAAPGTPTGKTGTPDAQVQYENFAVTINAVDDNWYPVTGVSDVVTFTTTDPDPLLPADTALVNGTLTVGTTDPLLLNLSAGTWTITVSDVTNPTITPDTSSQVTVNVP